MVRNQAKVFTDVLSVAMMAAPLGCLSLRWGHHAPFRSSSQGEDLIHLWMCDGGALASCPSWRHRIWSLALACGSGGGGHLEVLRVTYLVRAVVEVLRAHGR
jgi:hypothetical protein